MSFIKKVKIDWARVESCEDFYNQFLPQLDAPGWHSHNLDALADSIITGSFNGVEPSFQILSKNETLICEQMKDFMARVLEVFREAISEGRSINLVSR